MKKPQKIWMERPPKPLKPKVPEDVMKAVEMKAHELVEVILKPKCLKPPPIDNDLNYVADIYTRWYRNYFFFCARYNSPGPHEIMPFFETKFARMEYVGPDQFNLSFMRYTEQWVQIYTGISLEKCLEMMKEDPWFTP